MTRRDGRAGRFGAPVVLVGLALLVIGRLGAADGSAVTSTTERPVLVEAPRAADDLALRLPAGGGDGDSWHDTQGHEYRLGLVNAPETSECFGSEATQERRALTAGGFVADVYAQDRYGRSIAVVHTVDGRDLNVHLARHGFADDRYLAQFRDENPGLAARLDAAFAAARAEGRGLWGACRDSDQRQTPRQPPPDDTTSSGAGCHPDYRTCVAVQGDGSGLGTANDLDCGALPGAVLLHEPGVDPYRLDSDSDGTGCDDT